MLSANVNMGLELNFKSDKDKHKGGEGTNLETCKSQKMARSYATKSRKCRKNTVLQSKAVIMMAFTLYTELSVST